MSVPAALLSSPLFAVRETAFSGRGVYATQTIPKGTLLLETAEIGASVIYREYRKEVCVQCFNYDRGRIWKIRDAKAGVAFCSEGCRDTWTGDAVNDQAAWLAIEGLGKMGRPGSSNSEDEAAQIAPRPTAQVIETAWTEAEDKAIRIRSSRSSTKPSKPERRLLAQMLAIQPLRDILSYQLSGILTCLHSPSLWPDVLSLESESAPYTSPADLDFHITCYHHLLACVPLPLLPDITAEDIRILTRKSSHNVFNIWSQDLDDGGSGGSECLGYGLWTAASYWNHSCAPTVRKKRDGRMWRFWADRDVEQGEELCISYLGGDERDMSWLERRQKLKEHWKFDCACTRCADEGTRD